LKQEKSQRSGDVVVLDSEEEDKDVKRELSPLHTEQILTSRLPGVQVIDLTWNLMTRAHPTGVWVNEKQNPT